MILNTIESKIYKTYYSLYYLKYINREKGRTIFRYTLYGA